MLNSLDEVLEKLGVLPEVNKQALAALADEETKDMLWIPNPGPQSLAWFSEADEIFYGGQAGGGKTDLELGLALGPHKKILLLRRTNKEANGLVERMEGIVGNRDGWNSQQGMWRLNGKTIEIGGCQLEEDKQKYKGNPHDLICVGLGTPVLMANGTYEEVQNVKPGVYVMTLEGPRKVLKAFPVGKRQAVRLTVGGTSQIQSSTHKVLSSDGWASLGTPNALPPYLRLYPTPTVSTSLTLRTPRKRSYAHPYTMGERQSIHETVDSAYLVTPVGEVELYDLEVEEVNHFITKGGVVNKNCFDEVSDFSKTQYTFIITWNRSADKNQRCRIVAAGNPPTQPEGLWVVERWSAWLDPTHPNPAQPGELRWYTAGPDGHEIEVDGRGPHIVNGEEVFARSRTFIPASLSDNPDLAATDYKATLDALPEEYRQAYRDGNFQAGLKDDAFQTIPTSWVKAAQQRWSSVPPVGVPMCAIGCDVAQGGNDQTVLAIRHDGWYDKLIKYPGRETPDGKVVAGKVIQHRRDNCPVAIDVGGGWGGDAHGHLRANNVDSYAYMGVKDSLKRSADKQLKFFNVRAEAYWRFREALDPSQPGGSPVMLPDDPELVADLCAPKYQIGPNGIKIEPKADLKERLGRSPDKGDAVVMAWWVGPKGMNIQGGWKARSTAPKVNVGRVGNRRR